MKTIIIPANKSDMKRLGIQPWDEQKTAITITLTPAYGRDYTNLKDLKRDWNADKDFILQAFGHRYDGKPANKSDMKRSESGYFKVRYNKLTKVAMLSV